MFYKKSLTIFILLFGFIFAYKTSFAYDNYNYDSYDKEYDDYDEYDDYAEEYNDNKKQINDPFEKVNRKIFDFNYYMLNNFLIPASNMYKKITNQFVRDRISNVFTTMKEPLVAINSILMLDYKNTLKTFATFGTNITVGCLGLFNPAKNTIFYRDNKKFSDVLKFYGIPEGPYLMLPFLGPYNFRDSFGYISGFFINPVTINSFNIFNDEPWIKSTEFKISMYGLDLLNTSINLKSLNDSFLKKSLDPYILVREYYYSKK